MRKHNSILKWEYKITKLNQVLDVPYFLSNSYIPICNYQIVNTENILLSF